VIDRLGYRLIRKTRLLAVNTMGRALRETFLAPRFSGAGVIFVIHRVIDSDKVPLAPDLAISIDALDRGITTIKSAGFEIITMDQLHQRIQAKCLDNKIACLTLDDGYVDALTRALPVLHKHRAPACVYMNSGAISHEIEYWWGALEELLTRRDSVEIPIPAAEFAGNNHHDTLRACIRRRVIKLERHRTATGPNVQLVNFRLALDTVKQKTAAYAWLESICHRYISPNLNFTNVLEDVFKEYRICSRDLMERDFLSCEQARSLAADPLITIGSHGMTHRRFSQLPLQELEAEMLNSRRILQKSLSAPVEHIAYPYGGSGACGAREFETANRVGYLTGVTSFAGNLFDTETMSIHRLPRRSFGWRTRDIHISLCGAADWVVGRRPDINDHDGSRALSDEEDSRRGLLGTSGEW